MEFTAKQIAAFVQGTIEGDENAIVNSFSKIEQGKAGAISFLSNPKYLHYIYDTESTIVLLNADVVLEKPVKATLIRVKNAYESVARLLQLYDSMKPKKQGIDPLAFIAESAKIGENCYIGAFAYVGENVEIGDNTQIYPHVVIEDRVKIGNECLLYPNVSIYHDCRLGNQVTIHSGSVIGADGFGFAPQAEGYEKIPQIGNVIIEDCVEIGANTCVDRSTMGSTIIRKGVKLDNPKVGQWCMFGGQAGIAGHITVGDKTFLGAQCGLNSGTKGNVQLIGTPAMDPKGFFKSSVIFKKLPDMYKQLDQLQKEIDNLKEQLSNTQSE